MLPPRSIIRRKCFIGKGNFGINPPQSVSASFSNMKIYSRGLSLAEIQNEYNLSITSLPRPN